MKILGLDVGEKRIGVARADSSTRIAVPVGVVTVDGSEWQEIARLSRVHNTNFFVIGLPRSNEGNETAQSLYVRNFAKTLVKNLPEARVRFQDESLTSVVAEERLKSRKKKYAKGDIDAEAAAIILQDFLESFTVGKAQAASGGRATGARKNPSDANEEEAKMSKKKSKRKMKTVTKWISVLLIATIVASIVTGGVLWYVHREEEKRAYAEWVAEEEAKKAEVFTFTILPGETISDVKNKLVEAGYTETEVEAAFDAEYDFDFLKDRPEGATLEGYLYGETHEFYKTATVKEVIETFLKGMGEVIKENDLETKYADHGLSLFEGITLASIVQKEAPTSEMPTVAQVFLSRLSYGIPLGSDVTVSYALDQVDPDRQTYQDNQAALKVDSCYNTRLYGGLPCGPISNPGLSALLAVANPSDTAYLYFLTGDGGMMYYSYTEAEHIQNIRDNCGDLCNSSL